MPSNSTSTVEWHHRHVLDLDDFSSQEIALVLETAVGMKEVLSRQIKKVPTLRGKMVVTLFYEASTRTRISFELAAKTLSADVVNISASSSSAAKGESLIDTVRTIQKLGADVVIIRHYSSGAPYLAAQNLEISVINAGDGTHAHPSQALLDLYTVKQKISRLEGLKVAIVGDIKHSRVARSNIWGFGKMGAQVVLCAPPTLLPVKLKQAFPQVIVEQNFDKILKEVDVIMMLRLQLERHKEGFLPNFREYIKFYQLNEERLAKAKPEVLVLHPGPMNEGLEITPSVARGLQSLIEEQVGNGVAIRMALLYLLTAGSKFVVA